MEFWNDGFPKMHTIFPDGAGHGDVCIQHLTPTKQDASTAGIRAMVGGSARGAVRAGETLCQILVNGSMWMSDTWDERRDHSEPKWKARGHVLIGGLGFGMVALACALKEDVTKVTVIEINPDVIAFVVPYLREALESQGVDPDKIEVIEADLMEWKPPKGQMYEMIWFDIWLALCTDNLKDMATLNRRFGRRIAGYRGCWGENLLKYRRKQERIEEKRGARWRW